MCSPTKCRQCGKTTWRGCGNHVAQVKAMVPAGQWCNGHPKEAKVSTKASARASGRASGKGASAGGEGGGGFFARLFGR